VPVRPHARAGRRPSGIVESIVKLFCCRSPSFIRDSPWKVDRPANRV
jgi:hypothetical protein